MVKIYCITDCNGLNYVGSTKQTLQQRLNQHKYDKKRYNISSCELDLDNCSIKVLEECHEDDRIVREQYWIDNTNCINSIRAIGVDKNIYHKRYRVKHHDKVISYSRKHNMYIKSWGGDRRWNNNLLCIDVNLFT